MNAVVTIVSWVLGKFLGNTGQPVATAAVNLTAILPILGAIGIWLTKYDDTAAIIFKLPPWFEITFLWGHLAFLLVVSGLIVKFAHLVKSPSQN